MRHRLQINQGSKNLDDFWIAKELKKGIGRALADAVILVPNFARKGFGFKKMIEFFKNK